MTGGITEAEVRAHRLEAGRAAGVQAHRQLRRRVRCDDALYVFDLRGAASSASPRTRPSVERPQEGDDPRRRAEPDRAGDRVRLLLLPRRFCAGARRGYRDDHGQLQSGDGLDRLRHVGPPLFRAADRRGRARDRPTRAGAGRAARRHRPARRADAAEARRRRCRMRACRSSAPRPTHRPGRGPRAFRRAGATSWASSSPPTASRAAATRRSGSPSGSAIRCCLRPSYVLGGRGDGDRRWAAAARPLHRAPRCRCRATARC